VDIVLLGNLQNRLAYFGLNLFAVQFERNHPELAPSYLITTALNLQRS
jgi:hypothetical protein